MKCHYCGEKAVVKIAYAKLNLCSNHFRQFMVSRVENTIKRYKMVKPGDRILLAVSGGKDSVALLHIMLTLSNSIGFKLTVLHIDLGIGEYSRMSREVVEDLCKTLGVELAILDLRNDLGFTLPDLVSRLRTKRVCSLCGIIKRYVMNAVAIGLGVDSVATAHHGDDILTYIFKNFILQDHISLRKLTPISKGIPGLAATKIRPMYEVYEELTALYTHHLGLRHIGIGCPYKDVNAMEITVRRFLEELENKSPGIKISMLRRFAKTFSADTSVREEDVRGCSFCGLISQKDVCTFCKITKKIFGEPLGARVREKIRLRR